jgi:predicted  nucleic acid-binding Zn-ribbon protein
MKSDEERRNEIVAFARLKPDKQRDEVEKLEARVKAIDDEIVSNRKAVEVCQNNLKQVEQEVSSAKSQYSDARSKRQSLFALGMDTKDLDAEIWKLHLDLEAREALRTDAIAGFGSRVSDLSKELAFLEEEKNELRRTVLEFEQVPLIPKFNREIAQAMRTFEQIYEGQESLDYILRYHRTGGFQMIQLSGWEWLEHVGKVYLAGDIANEDQLSFGRPRWTWNLREYIDRRRKEREKAASE